MGLKEDGRVAEASEHLEIEQHLAGQERFWKVQRIWWGVLFLLILLAVLGLFGEGIFTVQTTSSGDLTIDYPVVVRNDAVARIEVESAVAGPEMEVTISTDYLGAVQLENITPQPDSVDIGLEEVTYVFSMAEGASAAQVDFLVRPQSIGIISATVTSGGEETTFRQVVLP